MVMNTDIDMVMDIDTDTEIYHDYLKYKSWQYINKCLNILVYYFVENIIFFKDLEIHSKMSHHSLYHEKA